MANIYIATAGQTPASPFATWATAYDNFATGANAALAGDNVFCDSAMAWAATTTTNIELADDPSSSKRVNIYSIDRTGDPVPPAAGDFSAGAAVGVTPVGLGGAVNFNQGHAYIYGLTFTSSTSSSGSGQAAYCRDGNGPDYIFDTCTFNLKNTDVNGIYASIGASGSGGDVGAKVEFRNCTFDFTGASLTGTGISLVSVRARFRDCSFIGPMDAMIRISKNSDIRFFGCDWTAQAVGDFIFDCDTSATNKGFYLGCFGCTYNGGGLLTSTPLDTMSEAEFWATDLDSANTNYNCEIYRGNGELTSDTAVYNAASDGTTPFSWKITADTTVLSVTQPFLTPWIEGWIDATGSTTITAHINYDSATNLQDDEVWLEIDYMGTANDGILSFDETSRNTEFDFGTPTDLTASTETWTGTGGFTNENKDKVAVTVTVNTKGAFRARLCVNTTQVLYLDPKIVVS